MPPSKAYLLGTVLIIPFRAALAQTSHIVTVGAAGSFFDPPTVSAALNDTVNFYVVGPAHSIVQAAFENPCFPLPGGFSSGFVRRPDSSSLFPVWSLKITNVTTAIWFYCQNTAPIPHCASGMVGAINPPSQAAYQQFLDAAKSVGTPPPPASLALTGVGAFATNSALLPTAASATTTSSLASSSVASSLTSHSSTATPTPSPVSTPNSKNGVIIGGSIAGGVVSLVLLTFLMIFLFRRRRRRQRRGSKDFFRYRAQTPTLGGGQGALLPSNLFSPPTDRSRATPLPPSSYSSPASQPSTLVPQRLPPPGRTDDLAGMAAPSGKTPSSSPPARPLPAPILPTPPSPPAPPVAAPAPIPPPPLPPSVEQKIPTAEQDAGSPDIHILAREVAAVLMRSPQQPAGRQPSNADNRNSVNSSNRTESPAPPRYRATVV